MELFDVVDRADVVIGVTNKQEAHERGILHRVAAVFVFNGQGELYVQVHKKSGGLLDHSVGGHVAQGEAYDIAARREAEEELGISQSLSHVADFYSDEGASMQHMFGLYECVADDEWEFVPNEEVEEIIPMKLGDIRALMVSSPERFTGGFINTMAKYTELKGE